MKLFKKGQVVEVKGDQVAGGSAWELYWFRGKVTQVHKKGRKATYNIKMEDPTRFGQKKLIVKNLEQRYVRSGEAQKKVAIGKKKKREKKKGGAYGAAGSEGSVCESWEQTLARERKEQEALGIVPEANEIKSPEDSQVGVTQPKDDEEIDELAGLDDKYRKGVDIRYKIEEIKTEDFHLMDRKTLRYGDTIFKKGDQVKFRDQLYEVKRIRMYKERPVLMLENRRDGLRRAECKDCKVEKSVDDIRAEEAKLAAEKLMAEEVKEKELQTVGELDVHEELNIDDIIVEEKLTIDDESDGDDQLENQDVVDVQEEITSEVV